jgi:hypothetical protein
MEITFMIQKRRLICLDLQMRLYLYLGLKQEEIRHLLFCYPSVVYSIFSLQKNLKINDD